MEVCISGNKARLSDPTNFSLKNPSTNGLKTCLKEIIRIEDAEISTTSLNISSEKSHKSSSIVREDDSIKSDNSPSRKCFDNRVAFLALGKSKPYIDGGNVLVEDEAFDSCVKHCAKPINQVHSQPTPVKPLVSAMKGSRKKLGMQPSKKLSVSWAADVYDPIPTSVSHVPSNTTNRKKQGKRNNNRKKQKGNTEKSSSRKRKDKKQAQKNNNNNNNGNTGGKLTKGMEKELDSNYNSSIVNRVVDPSSCGSSFLKESMSGTNLHFPVTEAK